MFKWLRNKKGVVAESTVIAIILGIGLVNVVYCMLPGTRTTFQKKKAITMCKETGALQCEEMIGSWPKDKILDYIRDDEPAQVRTNGGNFVGGYMN